MMSRGRERALARGMGRYFDAFGALALGAAHVSFEGQLALASNVTADPAERGVLSRAASRRRCAT